MYWQKILIESFGDPEVMRVVGYDALPEPTEGEVRVRVLAAGTGTTDTLVRRGQYPGVKGKLPLTPGYDWVGVVDKPGPGVTGFAAGDTVADLSVTGGYTQYLCVDAGRLLPVPAGLDPVKAVCMLLPYTTALQMLRHLLPLPLGASCLVHAGGGAVGTALLDLGRLLGLKMIATGSPSKRALIESFGAQVIDYRREDFVERSLAFAPGGLDAVFDTLGGASWARSRRCLRRGGMLVGYGALDMARGRESVASLIWGFARLLALWRLVPDGRHYHFYNIDNRRKKLPDQFREDVAALFAWLAEGRLQPVIDSVLPLSAAHEAHRRIEAAEVLGRIVLACDAAPEVCSAAL